MFVKIINRIQNFKHDNRGATAIEYALIAAGIAIVIITALGLVVEGDVRDTWLYSLQSRSARARDHRLHTAETRLWPRDVLRRQRSVHVDREECPIERALLLSAP